MYFWCNWFALSSQSLFTSTRFNTWGKRRKVIFNSQRTLQQHVWRMQGSKAFHRARKVPGMKTLLCTREVSVCFCPGWDLSLTGRGDQAAKRAACTVRPKICHPWEGWDCCHLLSPICCHTACSPPLPAPHRDMPPTQQGLAQEGLDA